MGWSGTGFSTISQLKKDIVCDFLGRVKKITHVNSVVYAAVEKKDNPEIIYAYIGKTRKEGKEIFVKDMTEFDGPNDSKCPENILNLLSKTDNEIALAWRERCKKYNEGR